MEVNAEPIGNIDHGVRVASTRCPPLGEAGGGAPMERTESRHIIRSLSKESQAGR